MWKFSFWNKYFSCFHHNKYFFQFSNKIIKDGDMLALFQTIFMSWKIYLRFLKNFMSFLYIRFQKNLMMTCSIMQIPYKEFCRIWCTPWQAESLSFVPWGSTPFQWTSKSAPFRWIFLSFLTIFLIFFFVTKSIFTFVTIFLIFVFVSKSLLSGWKFQLCDGQDCVQGRVHPNERGGCEIHSRLCNPDISTCRGGEAGDWADNGYAGDIT